MLCAIFGVHVLIYIIYIHIYICKFWVKSCECNHVFHSEHIPRDVRREQSSAELLWENQRSRGKPRSSSRVFTLVTNQRIIWVERDSWSSSVPIPLQWTVKCTASLDAQSSIQSDIECLQGWDIHPSKNHKEVLFLESQKYKKNIWKVWFFFKLTSIMTTNLTSEGKRAKKAFPSQTSSRFKGFYNETRGLFGTSVWEGSLCCLPMCEISAA